MISIKKISGFIGFLFLFAGSNADAATYYFSTSGNNTTGNGSLAAPFYSLCGPWPGSSACTTGSNRISLGQIAVNPGDQFLFERGKEWSGWDAVWTIDASGAPNNPLIFGAYGDSALPRPIFRGAKSAFELGKDSWTNVVGTPIWYTTGITSWPNVAAQEETAPGGPALYGAWSVQGVTNANGWTSNQSMVRGTYFYESSTQRLYVWRSDDLKPDHAAGREIYIGGAPADGTNRLIKVKRPNGVAGSHYVFQDLHAKMSSGYGFSTSYPNTSYLNCLSELNSMEGFLFDRRRFGAPLPGAKDSELRSSISRRNNLKQGSGAGQGITIEAENVWIYNSESYENAWAGVDFLDYDANTKTDGSGIVDSKIYNNGIQPVSQNCYDPNVYIDGGSNITIRNCQIWGAGVDPRGVKTRNKPNPGISIDLEGAAFAAGKRPTNIKVVNALSYGNMGPAIQVGLINGSQSTVRTMSNVHLIGNTFSRDRGDNDIPGYSSPSPADSGIRVMKFNNISSGFVFKNNIVAALNTVRAPIFGYTPIYNGGKSVMDFDYNMYYCPGCNFNVNGTGFFATGYSTNMTIDQFRNLGAQASLRQDESLSKTVITSNPLLTDLMFTSFDARLQPNSPAIDIANTAVFPFALTGTTRTDGAEDSPYNDLGFHYPSAALPPPPPPDVQAPSVPAGLTASLSGTQITLSWAASTDNVGVTGYQILDGASQVGVSDITSYSMTGTAGQNYSFTVKAFDAANNLSNNSSAVSVTVPSAGDTTAPTTPTGMNVIFLGNQALISWNPATDNVGVSGYQVYVLSTTPYGNPTTETNFTTGALYYNNGYNFKVRAFDAAGNYSAYATSGWMTLPSTVVSTPTNLTVSTVSGQAQLVWSASTNAAGYNVYRDNAFLKSVTTTSTFDNTVASGVTYQYKVNGFATSTNQSAFSGTVSLTIPGSADTTAPSAPANLAAALSGTTANLSWSASTDNIGVTGYQVFQGTTLKGTTANLIYAVTGLTQGQTHSFTVKAYDAANNLSGSSNTASVTVPPPADVTAPSIPTNLSVILSGTTANLSWNASTDNIAVTGYQVFDGAVLRGTTASLAYSITGLTQGQTYSFTVKAFDAANNLSAASNAAGVTVPPAADTTAPSIPANLTASLSGTTANLSWSASTDNVAVTGYQVFQGTTLKGTTANLTYAVTSLVEGQTHSFSVKAYDAANNLSGSSNTASVTVPVPGPSTPANLIAYMSGTSVYIGWSSALNATGYALDRSGAFLKNVTSLSTTDPAVSEGQSYTYQVRAFDASGAYSGYSNAMTVAVPDITAPSVPANLSASRSGTTANLSWSASTDNVAVTGYQVFQGTTLKGTTAALTYAVTGLTQGQTHSFTVKAYDAANNLSGSSNAASVTVPDTTAPSTPANLAATLSGTTANLSWSASTDNIGVTGYQVFQGTTLKGTTAALTYAVTGLTQGQTHSFTVKAYDAANNLSGSSNAASVTVPPPADVTAPSIPTNLSVTQSGAAASLSWTASTDNVGVVSYQVFESSSMKATVSTTSFTDSGLLPGQTYSYTVKAVDAAGNVSGASAAVSVTVQAPVLGTPTELRSALQGGMVSLFWRAAENAAGYQIYQNGAFRSTVQGTSTTFSPNMGLQRYRVRAYDAFGNVSAFSNEVLIER